MTRNEVKEKVIKIVAEVLNADKETVELTSMFNEDLGADSLDSFEMVQEIEDAFDVTIADSEVPGLKTPYDVIEHVCDKLKIK